MQTRFSLIDILYAQRLTPSLIQRAVPKSKEEISCWTQYVYYQVGIQLNEVEGVEGSVRDNLMAGIIIAWKSKINLGSF